MKRILTFKNLLMRAAVTLLVGVLAMPAQARMDGSEENEVIPVTTTVNNGIYRAY